MTEHEGGSAIVTGASRGIGAAVARRLARDGHAVAVNYAVDAAAARGLVREIERDGGRAVAIRADVADAGQVARLFGEAEAAHGPLRVLVSNAGLGVAEPVPIAALGDADYARVMAVNAGGVFNTLREAARRIAAGGRIVTVSSTTTRMAMPGYAAYVASKAAVEAMTRTLAAEMRGRAVTVNAVAPGPTATDMFLAGKPPSVLDQIAGMAPLERLGRPEDVADVVAFLAGPAGGWVNGQVIFANGGLA